MIKLFRLSIPYWRNIYIYIYPGEFGSQCTVSKVLGEISSYSDFRLHQIVRSYSSLSHLSLSKENILSSCKFRFLQNALPTLHSNGHRALIFSAWTQVDLISRYIYIHICIYVISHFVFYQCSVAIFTHLAGVFFFFFRFWI